MLNRLHLVLVCTLIFGGGALHLHGENAAPVFAPNSFWYTPIPENAPLHPNSANFVTEFLRQKKSYFGTVAINTQKFSSPIYIAAKDAPTVPVEHVDFRNKGYQNKSLIEQWKAVPLPPAAEPAEGSDAELSVYQPSTDTLWEFWKMQKTPEGKWQACWGGRMQGVSKNPGIWPNRFGTTATSLPFCGGQLTVDELTKGEIKHVIGIALVDIEKSSIYSWPAQRSDGNNPKGLPNWIAEGQRFRLDPAVKVDELKMHPLGKAIARAAQKYGFVVWDKGGAITLRADNPKQYTTTGGQNPYTALFNGTPSYAILQGLPWNKLQFLPMDYGKPSPAPKPAP